MIKRNIYSRVNWRSYLDPTDNSRVQRFLNMNGTEVFVEIVDNIDKAIDNNADNMMLLVHPHVTSIVVVKREEFDGLLNHCLNYLIDKEEYESCTKVTEVIKKNKEFQKEKDKTEKK